MLAPPPIHSAHTYIYGSNNDDHAYFGAEIFKELHLRYVAAQISTSLILFDKQCQSAALAVRPLHNTFPATPYLAIGCQ